MLSYLEVKHWFSFEIFHVLTNNLLTHCPVSESCCCCVACPVRLGGCYSYTSIASWNSSHLYFKRPPSNSKLPSGKNKELKHTFTKIFFLSYLIRLVLVCNLPRPHQWTPDTLSCVGVLALFVSCSVGWSSYTSIASWNTSISISTSPRLSHSINILSMAPESHRVNSRGFLSIVVRLKK